MGRSGRRYDLGSHAYVLLDGIYSVRTISCFQDIPQQPDELSLQVEVRRLTSHQAPCRAHTRFLSQQTRRSIPQSIFQALTCQKGPISSISMTGNPARSFERVCLYRIESVGVLDTRYCPC